MRRFAIGLALIVGLTLAGGLGVKLYFDWYTRASADPAFFADDIAAFEAEDRAHPPPSRPIVFVGSSSIRLWGTLAADMAPLPVIDRGFGGSRLVHAIHYADRIVIPYHPRAVVLYAGDNDLGERTGKHATDVADDFRTFASLVLSQVPDTRIYYIAIKPSPLRWARWPEMAKANAQIAEYCETDPRLAFLDVASAMLASGSPPARELFLFDGLHLSARGYALWTSVIKPRLLADFPDAGR